MASVTGPLMSFDASGSVGGAITFSKWKGRNYVRRHAIPSNPKSPAQVSTRSMMRFLTQYWASMTAVEQATWAAAAASKNISPFNEYVAYNMGRWTQGTPPWRTIGDTDAGAAVLGATTAVGQVGQIQISQVTTTPGNGWPLYVLLSTSPIVAFSKNLVAYIAPVDPIYNLIYLTGLAPGTYFVRCSNTSFANGSYSALTAEQNPTVT